MFASQAEEITICEGKECDRKQIIFKPEKGSGLLDFDKKYSDKLAPADLRPGDAVPFSGAPKRGLDLRWSELSVGMCLIDPTSKMPIYYKIRKLKQDKRNQVVYYVIEAENHQNALKANYVFFNSAQSGAFRKLRKVDCNRTPHLADEKYISSCLEGAQAGTHLCDYDSFLRP